MGTKNVLFVFLVFERKKIVLKEGKQKGSISPRLFSKGVFESNFRSKT